MIPFLGSYHFAFSRGRSRVRKITVLPIIQWAFTMYQTSTTGLPVSSASTNMAALQPDQQRRWDPRLVDTTCTQTAGLAVPLVGSSDQT